MHYLTVTDEVLKAFAGEHDKTIYNQRFIVTINGKESWRGGTVSLGNQSAYITFSGQRMKALGVVEGDSVDVLLEKDSSKYGFDVPEEFTELLKQDYEAKRRFDDLKMGMQRAIIYRVIQYKSSEKRIEKSIFFLENLKKSIEGETSMRHIIGKDLP